MANSLEFSPSGHPIENRYDGYGELLADSLPDEDWSMTDAQSEVLAKRILATRKIDEKRAAFLASGEPDDYCPFAQVEGEDDKVTK